MMTLTPRQARTADRRSDRALASTRAARRWKTPAERKDIDEVILVGGMTRMPAVQERGQAVLRQRAEQERQPGRSRGDWRGDSGGRAGRRSQGRPAAGRDAADARHRDAGRRGDADYRAQHDHPDQEEPDLQHGGGRPDAGRDPRPAGRTPDGRRTTRRSATSSWTAFRPRRVACRRSKSRSTSTRTVS